ncbi:uncharacterized protein LOC135387113 isoform X2 [Ornithodoros turicata]|uniref:uncharacterized protein LOC135387113 isoform X2 n=1 Tax=Ornithodoros turicata TaxID=34597 RepID=UPI003139DA2D
MVSICDIAPAAAPLFDAVDEEGDYGENEDSEGDENEDSEGDENEDSEGDETEFQEFLHGCGTGTLPNQTTTKRQAVLLILLYVVSAGLSWTQLDGLLKLINALFGDDILPRSKYMFRKIWKRRQEQLLQLHFFCNTCLAHLGNRGRYAKGCTLTWTFCNVDYTQGRLVSSGNFFDIFNIKKRLQMLLKNIGTVLHDSLRALSSRPQTQGTFCDMTDGNLYRDTRQKLGMGWSDITVSFNIDGSPAFESNNCSVWPIQLVINELPVITRWKNVIVCGLWFAKAHPPVLLFLNAFVQQFASMGPIVWKTLNEVVTSRVYAICCIADAPARASMLNRKQFNGFYGCSWCLKKGELVDGEFLLFALIGSY